jgi:quercetin dioxygenase-like cupin family protein
MPAFKFTDLTVVEMAPDVLRREVHTEHVMVTVVDFCSRRATVPLHQHPHEQISYVVEGRVNFVMGEGQGRTVELLEAGDMAVVPPNAPHTVEVLSESARVLDCFYPIRQDFL